MSVRAGDDRWLRWVLCASVWVCACVDGDEVVPLSPLDRDVYAQDVHPYVSDACATLDCHGHPGRPLRLYSELGWRIDDGLRPVALGDGIDPVPSSAEELDRNVLSFRALEPAHHGGDERLALTKPLARSAGGAAHVGGDLFDSKDDAGYRCLRGWLDGETDVTVACEDARGALGVE